MGSSNRFAGTLGLTTVEENGAVGQDPLEKATGDETNRADNQQRQEEEWSAPGG